VQISVGSDWTPPARRSISSWPSAWSERPHAKTSTLPWCTPVFLTRTEAERVAFPLYPDGRLAVTLAVPRGTRIHGTRTASLPAPLEVGVATIAPATSTSGVYSDPWADVATTPMSPGAIDGSARAAALVIRMVTLTSRLDLAGTVTEDGNDSVAPI